MSQNPVGYVADPPLYYFNGLQYNPDFYGDNTIVGGGNITKAYLDATYLKKIGVANSSATVTNFFGPVSCSQGLTLTGGINCDSIIASGSISCVSLSLTGTFSCSSLGVTGVVSIGGISNTSGIIDSVSISSPNITGTIVNGGTVNATNSSGNSSFSGGISIGGTVNVNIFNNSSSTLPYILYCGTVSFPSTTSTVSGMGIGWNALSGTGECDLINYGQYGGGGGFNFSTITNASVNRNLALLSVYGNGGFTINPACGQLRIQDINSGAFNTIISQGNNQSFYNTTGINSQIVFQCANASAIGANVMAMNTNNVQPFVNFSPNSTTTFNSFHPTTTLALPTLANQYATVGYVSSVNNPSLLPLNNTWSGTNAFNTSIPTTSLTPSTSNQFATVGYVTSQTPASLLPLNNTWTGLNTFTQRIQMTIKTDPTTTCIGTGSGGNLGTLATGSNNTLLGQSSGLLEVNSSNETICGGGSGPTVLGNYTGNTVIGSSSQYLGNNNTILGTGAGNFSTTVAYNNSTCIGSGTIMTASNQIVLGRSTENTIVAGTMSINSLLSINGNFAQPTGGILIGGVQTTFTTIPPYIVFVPVAGMSFVLPAPNPSNAGQMFVLRKFGVGGGQTIIFSCVGNLSVWVPLNTNTANTSVAISTTWQVTFVSVNSVYMQIA